MDCKLMWGWPGSKFSLQEWPWHFDSPTFLSVYSKRKRGTTSLVPTVKLLFTVHSPGENKLFFRWEKHLPRYKWYFVSKIVLTYCEKKYEPFIQTVKRGKTIFETIHLWNRVPFLLEFLCIVHIKKHWNNWIANWNKYKGTGTIRKQYFWLIDKNIIGNLKNIRLSWNRNKIWSWMHLYFTKIYIFHVLTFSWVSALHCCT